MIAGMPQNGSRKALVKSPVTKFQVGLTLANLPWVSQESAKAAVAGFNDGHLHYSAGTSIAHHNLFILTQR